MNQNVVLIFLKDDAKVIWGKGKGLFLSERAFEGLWLVLLWWDYLILLTFISFSILPVFGLRQSSQHT